jgi:hypothetical protein
MSSVAQGNKNVSAEEVVQELANNDAFIEKMLTSPQFKSELAKHLSKEDFIEKTLTSPGFESELAKHLSKEKWVLVMANNEDFIRQTLTPQLKSELARRLSKEKWVFVISTLILAIFSFLIMGGVYWLSLSQGGVDAIKTFAVPIIGAFCLVILVINIAFSLTVLRVTR